MAKQGDGWLSRGDECLMSIPIYNYLYKKSYMYLSKIQEDRTSHSQL
jgi:hypothetical protein